MSRRLPQRGPELGAEAERPRRRESAILRTANWELGPPGPGATPYWTTSALLHLELCHGWSLCLARVLRVADRYRARLITTSGAFGGKAEASLG